MAEGSDDHKLGWVHGMALVVGSIVGSGLFVSPGDVFAMCGSVGYGLVVWTLAGLLCLIGGLCYAELGCAVERSGGEYAIFVELLGRPFGFAFAWVSFWVQAPAAMGLLGITFARYVSVVVFPRMDDSADIDSDWRVKGVAIAAIVTVAFSNSFGLKGGAMLNTVLTGLKLVAVTGVIILGLSQVETGAHHFEEAFEVNTTIHTGGTPGLIGLAVIAALWSYDGWNTLNYLTASLDRPSVNLPRCIVWGMLMVIAITVLTNVAFLLILPPDVVASSKALAIAAGEKVLGSYGGYVMSMVVAFNVYGVLQTALMSYPFIYNEAALDGLAPYFLTDPKRDIALPAIWIPTLISLVMAVVGDFTVLTQIYGVTIYIFYALAMVSLIVLRRTREPSAYRVPLYPLLPIVFIICSVALVVNAVISAPVQSVGGVLFCVMSYPVYLLVDCATAEGKPRDGVTEALLAEESAEEATAG
uniref:Amino acid permease n=1 Tax=Eutreptiella gymnastica TaxID=73025 RepID=A0A7S4G518_9EUGL